MALNPKARRNRAAAATPPAPCRKASEPPETRLQKKADLVKRLHRMEKYAAIKLQIKNRDK